MLYRFYDSSGCYLLDTRLAIIAVPGFAPPWRNWRISHSRQYKNTPSSSYLQPTGVTICAKKLIFIWSCSRYSLWWCWLRWRSDPSPSAAPASVYMHNGRGGFARAANTTGGYPPVARRQAAGVRIVPMQISPRNFQCCCLSHSLIAAGLRADEHRQ